MQARDIVSSPGLCLGDLSSILGVPSASRQCDITESELWLLGQHQISHLEVLPGISDELRVAWMIHRFHSDDDIHQLGVVVVNVLDQLGLRIGRSGNENRAGICNCFSGGVKIGVIFRGVTASNRICLVMDVPGGVIRVQHQSFDICRAEMEHARFMVIDPNNGMIVMVAHWTSPFFGDMSIMASANQCVLLGKKANRPTCSVRS
jgi:hypothetical protein